MHQLKPPESSLTSIKRDDLELVEGDSETQVMLHEKMMMDPVISLVLFNEYIPLRQPKQRVKGAVEEVKLDEEMSGLFLGKIEEEDAEAVENAEIVDSASGLFIRSELPQVSAVSTSGGLFIRSDESSSSPSCSDDWVIA